MLQFYSGELTNMGEAKSKTYSIGEIILAFVYCSIISFFIYAVSVFYIFGAWHCPNGDCQTPTWVNATIFLILASPFFIFPLGAYFARNAIYALTASKISRILIILAFALFPVYALAGLIVYIANSQN